MSRAAAGAPYGAADAAERVEIMIDGGDAEFDGIEILVGDVHVLQHVGQHRFLSRRATVNAIGETLATNERFGQFVLVVPAAAIDQMVDVGAVGAIGIAEHAQCSLRDIASMRVLAGQRVLADEVHLKRLVGLRRKQGGFGDQLGLQRQQVAENPGEGDDNVDARAAECLQRDQLCAHHAAVTVRARFGAHQPQHLGDRAAFGLQVVGAPQHHRDGFGVGVAILAVPGEQGVGLPRTVAHGECARYPERIESVQVAAGRQNVGRPQQVAARRRSDVACVKGAHDGRRFVVGGEQGIERCTALRFGDARGIQHFRTRSCGGSLANDMKAVRDQRIFEFEYLAVQPRNLGIRGVVPGRLGCCEFDGAGLRLDHGRKRRALSRIRIGIHRPPAID